MLQSSKSEKPRLIILSDLYGWVDRSWLQSYTDLLTSRFDIKCYDSGLIAGIDPKITSGDERHQIFVNGGIERAIKELLKNESKVHVVLAFSVGGVIAWKALLNGLESNSSFFVSSTRLRYETEKPEGRLHLYYGSDDPFRPKLDWFKQMGVSALVIENQGHDIYKQSAFIKELCSHDDLK